MTASELKKIIKNLEQEKQLLKNMVEKQLLQARIETVSTYDVNLFCTIEDSIEFLKPKHSLAINKEEVRTLVKFGGILPVKRYKRLGDKGRGKSLFLRSDLEDVLDCLG